MTEGAGGFLTREQVAQLAEEVSAGDVLRAQRQAKGDATEVAVLTVSRAAIRAGLVAESADPMDALDRFRASDLQWLSKRIAGTLDPTEPSSEGSPASADTGA